MYQMIVDFSGEQRIFIFRGPRCRKKMRNAYDNYRNKAIENGEIRSIRVWGTDARLRDLVLEWVG